MKLMSKLPLFLLAGLLTRSAVAQVADTRLTTCAGNKDDRQRLACYDRLAGDMATQASPGATPSAWSGTGFMTTRPFHIDGPWDF